MSCIHHQYKLILTHSVVRTFTMETYNLLISALVKHHFLFSSSLVHFSEHFHSDQHTTAMGAQVEQQQVQDVLTVRSQQGGHFKVCLFLTEKQLHKLKLSKYMYVFLVKRVNAGH